MTSRSELSRVTLVGERRRADIVLPSDTPIGQLLPDILQLLDDRAASRPLTRQLITSDGSALPHDSTLASAGISDGAVLRLVRIHAAPPAPVVHDVTDQVADTLDLQAWRWRPAARRVAAGASTVAFAVIVALLARREFPLDALAGALAVVTAVLLVGGALCARIGAGNRGLATALLFVSGGLGVLTAWTAADAYGWSGPVRLAAVAAAVALALLLLGLFSPLGRGGLIGAGATAAVAAVWEAVAAVESDPARLGAVMAVFSVVLLGMLPRLALMASGLTGLDDRRSGGVSVSRHDGRRPHQDGHGHPTPPHPRRGIGPGRRGRPHRRRQHPPGLGLRRHGPARRRRGPGKRPQRCRQARQRRQGHHVSWRPR